MLTFKLKNHIFTLLAVCGATSLGCAQTAPVELLPTDLTTFKAYGQGAQTSQAQTVPVAGQKFAGAMRFTTLTPPTNFWDYGATIPTLAPVKAGDVLWVSLWARRVSTLKESGEAQCEVAFLQRANEKEVRPLARVLSFGANWTQFTLPFQLQNDSATGQARLAFRYGYGRQSLEIGGIQVLNYGPNV